LLCEDETTGGKFRLIERLLTFVEWSLQIKELPTVTQVVMEAV
jgi:hypothetical protein